MPNLDFVQLQKIVAEAANVIIGSQLRRISQPDKHTIVLELRAPQRNCYFLFSVAKGTTRCHLLTSHLQNPPSPPAFCQILRKYLESGRIVGLKMASDDRIVTLTVERTIVSEPPAVNIANTPLAPATTEVPVVAAPAEPVLQIFHYALVAELWGSHANMFLLDGDQKILGTLYFHRRPERATRVGDLYTRMPVSGPPAAMRREDFLEKFVAADADDPWNYAAAKFYSQNLQQSQAEQKYQTLVHWLTKESARLTKLIVQLKQDLENTAQGEQLRIYGELLKPLLAKVVRGSIQMEASNYFEPGNPKILIPLDNKLSAKENMEKYFKKYQKLMRSKKSLTAELIKLEQDLAILQGVWSEAADAGVAALETLHALLPAHLHRRFEQSQTPRQSKAKTEVRLPYYTFRSVDDYPILVGRSGKDNEMVTFKVARGSDWWLHAADYPGSHVIVKCVERAVLPQETLIDAAHLAAHYSKAKGHTKVNIIYTQRKFISKPKHTKPGTVFAGHEKHFQVVIEPERLDRLLAMLREIK